MSSPVFSSGSHLTPLLLLAGLIAGSLAQSRVFRAAPGAIVDETEVTETATGAPFAPVLRPPPGWGPPNIPDPPGTAVEESMTVESGPAGGMPPMPPPIPPPPPALGSSMSISETVIAPPPMGKKKYGGGYGYQKYGGGVPFVPFVPPAFVPVKKHYYSKGGGGGGGNILPPWLWGGEDEEWPFHAAKASKAYMMGGRRRR